MTLQLSYTKHQLQFRFEAGTSRGILKARDTYFIKVSHRGKPDLYGLGEASPLQGLSVDDLPDFESRLQAVCQQIEGQSWEEDLDVMLHRLEEWVSPALPALRFGLETAFRDLYYGGKRQIFDTPFYKGKQNIKINGLIWMGNLDFMQSQIEQKLEAGFSCIKMKIGAIDFEQEYQLLADIRKRFPADQITLRVDANGAFSPAEAPDKLAKLAKLELHSIEQPIAPQQEKAMAQLCAQTPLPIALDEELIGIQAYDQKKTLLEQIKPQYIILKPTLLGGLKATQEWISLAGSLHIGWWVTSALESNVGLNAICQLTSSYHPSLPQGLGTGGLYHNNIPSPLELKGEYIHYQPEKSWDIHF